MHIDFKKKKLRGTVEGGGGEESTEIRNLQKLGDRTLLQGAENGRGWSIVIDAATGDMSAAIAGDDIGFLLFGVWRASQLERLAWTGRSPSAAS